MNLSTLLRRRTMMMQANTIPYDTLGYGVLYPKSAWRPHPHINIIYEMKNHPEYVCGISYSDETPVVELKSRGSDGKHIMYKYMLNGIVHTEEKNALNHTFTFPEGATERISLHFDVNFYGTNVYTITESQCVVWNVTQTKVYYTEWLESQQVLIAPECISYSFGQAIKASNGFGGEIDTCWLDFKSYSINRTYYTRWTNNLELETVYLRKNVKTIGSTFSFTGDSNLKDLYVEWTLDEDIIKWVKWMTFPADMTLHIPKGTRELYDAKGWGRYNIEEYTQ